MAKKIKSFDEIIGHRNQLRYLKRCIENDNIQDVMIFHGNPGIGKSSIAKLLAIEVTTRYSSSELREAYTKTVIMDNQSTDSIKLFNMSEIQEKEEEIQKVKAELSVGFSKTGRKVLILDEAHNMSRKAQDAILTDLEHLPKDIYVFICTTEIGSLREALLSRSKGTIRLNDLTSVETKRLIRDLIAERMLSFDTNLEMVVALVADWAGNQPRKACNLLENFPENSLVTSNDLEVFIETNSVASIIELLKYLYGSMTLGMDYLDSIKYDTSFASVLIEVCKVALGHISQSVSAKDTRYIKEFMEGRDTKHILQFTAEVAGLSTVQKRRVISAFIRAHASFITGNLPQKDVAENFKMEDINTLIANVESTDIKVPTSGVQRVKTIEEMMGNAESIVD